MHSHIIKQIMAKNKIYWKMKNIPKKIYLQIPEGCNDLDDFNEFYPGEMTWAAERINKDDIEYVLSKKV